MLCKAWQITTSETNYLQILSLWHIAMNNKMQIIHMWTKCADMKEMNHKWWADEFFPWRRVMKRDRSEITQTASLRYIRMKWLPNEVNFKVWADSNSPKSTKQPWQKDTNALGTTDQFLKSEMLSETLTAQNVPKMQKNKIADFLHTRAQTSCTKPKCPTNWQKYTKYAPNDL